MSIRSKLLTIFSVSVIVTILTCMTIFIQLQTIEKEYSTTLDKSLPQTYLTADTSRFIMFQATLVQNYLSGKDTLAAIDTRRTDLNNSINELEKSLATESDSLKALIAELKVKITEVNAGFDQAILLSDTTDQATASAYYIAEADMRVIESINIAMALSSEIAQLFDQAQLAAEARTQTALILAIVSIIVTIAIGVIASIILTKIIAKPLHKLESHVQEITKGNLAIEPIQIKSKDEIGNLAKAINDMKDTLSKLLFNLSDNAGHLGATSEQLMASAEEVHASSTVMLEGATEGAHSARAMATSASESAIAMDETATAVQKIAESSQELHRFASDTEGIALVGTQNIHTASNQMSSIYESTKLTTELIHKLSKQSEEIESIAKVITSITDQTNLLALNAAIEAARAGEHGKGFAVVADEVRKLAEESNRSAGQIGTLTTEIQRDTKNVELAIQESLHNVERGVGIIDLAGGSFDQIASAIGQMKAQIEDVSAVTEQISAASEQVAASVSEIARDADSTRLNAEHALQSSEQQINSLTEIASVASDLSNRAQELQQVVSHYRV